MRFTMNGPRGRQAGRRHPFRSSSYSLPYRCSDISSSIGSTGIAPTQFIAGSCVATWHASAIDVTIYGITFVLSLLLVIVPSAMPLPERKSPPWLHSASGRSC